MIKLPLVGAAYKMQSQSISCQNCINWYPQTIEYPNGSRVAALMPTPGLKKVFSGDVAATRCLYVLSNGALLAVIGKKLYHSKASKFELTEVGSISALGTVRIADNGQIALIVNGTYTYSLNLKTLSLERLSGSTIPRSTHVLFLDGRFVVNKANTGQFYWSDLYSTTVNALSYATAESTPDNITAIITFNRELWLFGAQSVERYYGTGSSNSPYSRLSGGAMAFGCVAPDSIIALSTGVIWLGVSEFGGNQIVMSAGGLPERISTHALEEEISSFIKTSDASAYAYQQEGHVFYVISFPSANVTFCFDVSTGLWHQRSFTNVQGLHERHRSQHHAYFNNAHIVGDYRNGKLYQLDNNTFTDDGELILRERTAQAVITDKKLTRFNQLQIVCETGFFGETKKVEPEPPSISCEGATGTTILGLPVDFGNGRSDLDKVKEIWVDGVLVAEGEDLLELDQENATKQFGNVVFRRQDRTVMVFTDSPDISRVKLNFVRGTEGMNSINIGEWNTNPTVMFVDVDSELVMCLLPSIVSCEPSTFEIPELNEYRWANSSNGITYTVNNSEKKVVVFGSTGTTSSLTQSFENAVLYSNLTEPFTHNGYSFDEYFNLNTSDSVLQIKGNSDDSIKDPITVRFYPLIPTDDAPYNIDMYWDIWKAIKGLLVTDPIPSIIDYDAEFIELHSCGRL